MNRLQKFLARYGVYISHSDWKTRFELEQHYKDGYIRRLEEVDARCSECFLDQAALRKNIEDLTADYGKLADEHGVVCQALAVEKRSSAALRGQITRMKKGKVKA